MVLRPGSSVCNAGGDIQSGLLATERDYHDTKDLTCILESVENELHFSSKVSLADYIQSFIEKEVNKLIPFPEKDKFSEVT